MSTVFVFLLGFGCGAAALYLGLHLPYRSKVARQDAERRDIDRIKRAFVAAASQDLSKPEPTVEIYTPIYPGNTKWRDDPDPAWLRWLTEIDPSLDYWRDRRGRRDKQALRSSDPDLGDGPVRPATYREVQRAEQIKALPWSSTDWVAAVAVWPLAVWSDRPAYPLWQKALDWLWEHTWPYERPIYRSAMRVNRGLTGTLSEIVETWVGWAKAARTFGMEKWHAVRR